MTDPSPYPDAGAGTNRGSPPSTPRWVKIFGIIALILVLLLVIVMIAGGDGPGGDGSSDHGPGRHSSSGRATGQPLLFSGRDNSGAKDQATSADEVARSVADRAVLGTVRLALPPAASLPSWKSSVVQAGLIRVHSEVS